MQKKRIDAETPQVRAQPARREVVSKEAHSLSKMRSLTNSLFAAFKSKARDAETEASMGGATDLCPSPET
jgi:hypothetical protein